MMKISEVINRLQEIQKEYGDLNIVCYDNSANNIGLLDGTIDSITVLFNDEEGKDYVEIGFDYEMTARTKSKKK